MRTSMLRLYAPFIAIAMVQAMFIAIAPSGPASRSNGSETAAPAFGDGGVPVDPDTGRPIDPATGEPAGGSGTGTGSFGGSNEGGGPGVTTPGGGPSVTTPRGAAADMSHCKGPYQFDILHSNPLCVAKWPKGADNGGATFRGVTKDKIKIVFFSTNANPAVQSILSSQGLARTNADMQALVAAATKFINTHYELHGRKVEIFAMNLESSPCPQTPPDVDKCIQTARNIVKEHNPFMVLWDSGLYPDVFDEFARMGVVTLGGWHFSEEYFTKRRPYRYDVFMDGTRTADVIADYYCKNMAGGNATHSGQIIHPQIGQRGQVRRRVGISVPEVEADYKAADYLAARIRKCDPTAQAPIVRRYESNIERAQEQSDATTAAWIANKVTTTVCMCDPIAPAFATKNYTQNSYYPEILMPGMGLLDFDKLGRLYDSAQMVHAFGPSHLQLQPRHEDSDASRMWRSAGNSGTPCQSCNLPWAYMALGASMLQAAGPVLTPTTVERGTLTGRPNGGWEMSGHDPAVPMIRFGPGDYSGISDARIVWWSNTAPSSIDGNPGSYVSVQGGRRWEIGKFPDTNLRDIPVASS